MQVKSIAKCSKGSILQYFRPSLSYHLSIRSLFCLFLSGRARQVLLSKYTICSIVLIRILTKVITGSKVYHISLNIRWPQFVFVGKQVKVYNKSGGSLTATAFDVNFHIYLKCNGTYSNDKTSRKVFM